MKPVTKAVIPAAGYGTRMLPITKTISKEILPLVDKPIIQYVVEELTEAGITDIIIVTSQRKADLVDYFSDVDAGLLDHLKANQKHDFIKQLEDVHKLANIAFIEQRGTYGTGTPVLNAEPYLGGEPFVFTYADDFFMGEDNSVKQMIAAYEKYDAPVDGCMLRDSPDDFKRYGYVGGHEVEPGILELDQPIIERPGIEKAPSKLAQAGGFVVKSNVLSYLHSAKEQLQEGQELYFHSALNLMLEAGERVVAKEITNAQYFDTGNKLEYMKTAVAMAARHPEIGDAFRQHLKETYA